MSFFGEIYADPDLPHRARTVYMYLRDRAGGGSCWPGIKTIARDLRLSPRTVQRARGNVRAFAVMSAATLRHGLKGQLYLRSKYRKEKSEIKKGRIL